MTLDDALTAKLLELVANSRDALVGSVDANGYPNIKVMFRMENEGLKTFWFSTNTSSKRVAQFRANPKASIYFCSPSTGQGLMLVGTMEVTRDPEALRRLWRDGFERYYPQGVDDPDYSVLRFTATKGNYYHALSNVDFDL